MKKLFTLLALFSALFCQAQDKPKQADPFVGMDKAALIKRFGQPDSVIKDDPDGTILVYKRHSQTQGSYKSGKGTSMLISAKDETFMFQIDRNDKVSSWQCSKVPKPAGDAVIAD